MDEEVSVGVRVQQCYGGGALDDSTGDDEQQTVNRQRKQSNQSA